MSSKRYVPNRLSGVLGGDDTSHRKETEAMSSKRYVPNRLSGVLGGDDTSSRGKGRKSRPWRVDAGSWKQQLQERKAAYDKFALQEKAEEERESSSQIPEKEEFESIPLNVLTSTNAELTDEEWKIWQAEKKKRAEEEEKKRKAEAETKRKAEEAEAERKAEVEAKRRVEIEAAKKRKAEAEAKWKATIEAAEAKRKAEEAEKKRNAEAKAKKKAAEAEAKRKAEAEAKRKAEEAEAKRKAEEVEAKRQAEIEAAAKKYVEEEKKKWDAERIAEEAEAKRKAEEAEAKRQAEIEAAAKELFKEAEAKRQAEIEAAAKKLFEEAEAKRKAEEEAKEGERTTVPIISPGDCTVMISFNDGSAGEDAETLANFLTGNGHPTFCTRLFCPRMTGDWREITTKGVRNCKYYIMLMTKGWQVSYECQFETKIAINRWVKNKLIPIPVWYEDFDFDIDEGKNGYDDMFVSIQSVQRKRGTWMKVILKQLEGTAKTE